MDEGTPGTLDRCGARDSFAKAHPAHQEVSAYCNSVRESRTVVDYEV
ncbi:MAG: Dabb family protein [Mediterranea sp.]|nr:Dabb family protein [Mediterranea sp.]